MSFERDARDAVVTSAKHLVKDYNRFARGDCDEASFEDRIDQLAEDIAKYRATDPQPTPTRSSAEVAQGLIAALKDIGWRAMDIREAATVARNAIAKADQLLGIGRVEP